MASLYLVRDGAANDFYVVADDDISAKVAYQDWVQDPATGWIMRTVCRSSTSSSWPPRIRTLC